MPPDTKPELTAEELADLRRCCDEAESMPKEFGEYAGLQMSTEDARKLIDAAESLHGARACLRTAVDATTRAVARERALIDSRAQALALLRELADALKDYVEVNSLSHDDPDCPEDDTCDCVVVQRLSKALDGAFLEMNK